MKFKGYIFDMDGTLIDNGRYHILAWQEFAKRHVAGEGLALTIQLNDTVVAVL